MMGLYFTPVFGVTCWIGGDSSRIQRFEDWPRVCLLFEGPCSVCHGCEEWIESKFLSVKAVACCTVHCSPSRGGGNVVLLTGEWNSSQLLLEGFIPLCKTVQKAHSRIHNGDTYHLLWPSASFPKPSIRCYCGFPHSGYCFDEAVYVSAAPAVVCGGIIYGTLNLITFHEF